MPIDPATAMGAVRLRVADLDQARAFYRDAIGLEELGAAVEQPGQEQPEKGQSEPTGGDPQGPAPVAPVRMGIGERSLVELIGDPDAPLRPPGTTGLFHLAILVPTRADLARAIRRVIGSGRHFTGASDHLVSEALYLDDPEGNGIEIYRDRPRSEWEYEHGSVRMDTLPLDLVGVVAEIDEGEIAPRIDAGTTIGHVHLNVAEIAAAEGFYAGVLGFEPTVRWAPSALFVSAGGYHHHLGLNTWTGEGAPPPPPGARGLDHFEVIVPRVDELDRIEARARDEGVEPDRASEDPALRTLALSDPFGNRVMIRTSTPSSGN